MWEERQLASGLEPLGHSALHLSSSSPEVGLVVSYIRGISCEEVAREALRVHINQERSGATHCVVHFGTSTEAVCTISQGRLLPLLEEVRQ